MSYPLALCFISLKVFPLTYIALERALEIAQITDVKGQLSSAPLTRDMVEKVEQFLHNLPVAVGAEVTKWNDGRTPCHFPPVSEALEKRNGEDPASDLVFLLYAAITGDI